MKKGFMLAVLIALVFMIPSLSGACPIDDPSNIVFEVTEWVFLLGLEKYDFVADMEPYQYLVTLSDLSTDPYFGFQFLFLAITTATEVIGFTVGPGSFTFTAIPGETYWINVFAIGGGELFTGLFGVEVAAVPLPMSLLLFGSGLLGMIFLRRRKS